MTEPTTHTLALDAVPAHAAPTASFQTRVAPWMRACFGPEISADRLERGDRFIEDLAATIRALVDKEGGERG